LWYILEDVVKALNSFFFFPTIICLNVLEL
jgi:hypothetical protein